MKLIRSLIVLLAFLSLFAGCGFQASGKKSDDNDTIVTTDQDTNEVGDEIIDETVDEKTDTPIDEAITDEDNKLTPDSDQNLKQDEDENTFPDSDHGESDEVAIATWNVHRFFDTECQSGECGASDYEELPSTAEFNAQADDIAEGITAINADVIFLQEVESEACMEALATRLGYSSKQWTIVENRYRKGDVYTAIMTKGTIIAHSEHAKTDSGYFSRPLLQATINYGGEFIVFVAHFKSQSNDNPELRLAEAEKAHDIVNTVALDNDETLVVLGGDLNDTPNSPPLNALLDGGNFLRVAEELGHPGDATYYYRQPITIDHILMSTRAGGTFLPGSAEIFKQSSSSYNFQDSDHAAVRAEFKF